MSMSDFICESCKKEGGTVRWNEAKKRWECDDCFFKEEKTDESK